MMVIFGASHPKSRRNDMHDYAEVIKNEHGDFEVLVRGIRVAKGYFSRQEDYACMDADKLAGEINIAIRKRIK